MGVSPKDENSFAPGVIYLDLPFGFRAARNDLQLIYLKGQLKSAKSFHVSYGNKQTLQRINILKKRIAALQTLIQPQGEDTPNDK